VGSSQFEEVRDLCSFISRTILHTPCSYEFLTDIRSEYLSKTRMPLLETVLVSSRVLNSAKYSRCLFISVARTYNGRNTIRELFAVVRAME